MTATLHTIFYESSLFYQIFAHPSPFAKISEQLIEIVKSSGLGKLTAWSPQQFILNHPVLYIPIFTCPDSILTIKFFYRQPDGSFPMVVLIVLQNLLGAVSLCKVFLRFIYNSSWCLPYRRICWPIAADQPAVAAHLTENLNVAFELFQVRTGEGLKPLARNGLAAEGTREAVGIEIRQTIDLCRSEKGQEMRRNAEQLKVKFAQTWEEDGMARQEIRKFLHKYT